MTPEVPSGVIFTEKKMKLCTLVSGSSGNSTYISDGTTSVLVDAGLTGKRIEEELSSIGVSAKELSAVFVTHEHNDHITSVGVIARRYGIPVYANRGTMKYLDAAGMLNRIMPENLIVFENNKSFLCGTMTVKAFPIPHDATDPVGYRFTSGGVSVAVSTDIGEITDDIREGTKGCAAVVLEANHDIEMLKTGPYPYPLKKRILGRYGHLSNVSSADYACELAEEGTETIILGHLSKENNLPELAFETVTKELKKRGLLEKCSVMLAPRYSHGELIVC